MTYTSFWSMRKWKIKKSSSFERVIKIYFKMVKLKKIDCTFIEQQLNLFDAKKYVAPAILSKFMFKKVIRFCCGTKISIKYYPSHKYRHCSTLAHFCLLMILLKWKHKKIKFFMSVRAFFWVIITIKIDYFTNINTFSSHDNFV